MFNDVTQFIKELYPKKDFIPLHEPILIGNEKKYLEECIDSTFVSSVGKYVDKFEQMVCEYTGAQHAVATMNGTAALHIAMKVLGVNQESEVITQALTFVATCNAISYCGANPLFVDVDKDTLGMSPRSLEEFLTENTFIKDGICINKISKKKISACVPMHTFGHPCRIDSIVDVCNKFYIPVVEDSAESIGSKYKGKHTGTFGKLGILSFNGNKTITCGGGGMIITGDQELAKHLKHLTTTAKKNHPYEFNHDMVGYNYRLPNINAALGCAQMEKLESFVLNKRELAQIYKDFFKDREFEFVVEPSDAYSNYWLNTIIVKDNKQRDQVLEESNRSGVMTRPIWKLMNKLDMYKDCYFGNLENSEWLEERIINLPSSVRI